MNERVVFMGTPDFAVSSLRALTEAGVDVAAVVTAPDKPAGRGQRLRMSPVKEFALEHPVLKHRILQPPRLKDPDFHEQLNALAASLYIVVAFRMLPETVWSRPALGTINLHASVLPDYRGAAPINWVLINGEDHSGVTTFFIRHEIDTGDIIASQRTGIGPDETAGELHDRLKMLGADLLVSTVRSVFAGGARRTSQAATSMVTLHHAPKLTPELCHIDVNAKAQQVHDRVRGLSPFPGAWAQWVEDGRPPQHFRILRTRLAADAGANTPGAITIDQGRILLQCATGRVELLEVQAEGRRRMDGASFARGLQRTNNISLQ